MINLNRSLKVWDEHLVKPARIHKVIHSFCGKMWKSPKDKQFSQKMNAIVQS
jgi:hypothetical protein